MNKISKNPRVTAFGRMLIIVLSALALCLIISTFGLIKPRSSAADSDAEESLSHTDSSKTVTAIMPLDETNQKEVDELLEEFRAEQAKVSRSTDNVQNTETEETDAQVLSIAEETQAPEPQLVRVGTYRLTAYCHCAICCGTAGQPTASGVMPEVGVTVACNDPRLWGKEVYIDGYGSYVVQDTGGMDIRTIDIFFGDHQSALDFGVQWADVYIYE